MADLNSNCKSSSDTVTVGETTALKHHHVSSGICKLRVANQHHACRKLRPLWRAHTHTPTLEESQGLPIKRRACLHFTLMKCWGSGSKTYHAILRGGGEYCRAHFWKPQKVLDWSGVPISCDRASPNDGGKTYYKWGGGGPKIVLGGRVLWYVLPSAECSSPPSPLSVNHHLPLSGHFTAQAHLHRMICNGPIAQSTLLGVNWMV